MEALKKMVVGFLMDESQIKIALIEKSRPNWQTGRFNGVGGHVEKGENPTESMIREFREETGKIITTWRHFATLTHLSRGGLVYFFVAKDDAVFDVATQTDEQVSLWLVKALPEMVMPNLRWLIPMALDETLTEPIEIMDRGKN
jgi:8-oxo-dGTP diphosphatase